MTEKIGGVEGTKLDVDFVDMERVNVFNLICHYCTYYTVHKLDYS